MSGFFGFLQAGQTPYEKYVKNYDERDPQLRKIMAAEIQKKSNAAARFKRERPANAFLERYVDDEGYNINEIKNTIDRSLVEDVRNSLTNDINNNISNEDLLRKYSDTITQIKQSLTNAGIYYEDNQVLDAIRYIALSARGGKRRARKTKTRKSKKSKRSKRGTRRS